MAKKQEPKNSCFFISIGGWVKEIIVVTSYRK